MRLAVAEKSCYTMCMAEDKIACSDITWDELERRFAVVESPKEPLFAPRSPLVSPTAHLLETIRRARRTRLANERARATRLVDPVLVELETLRPGRISSFLEVPLATKGLSGVADFVVSGGATHKIVPILTIIEAKRDDIEGGLPQCAAELYMAYQLNGQRPKHLFGCVTTGDAWQFLRYSGETRQVTIDVDVYFIVDLARLLDVLCQVVDESLGALA